MVGFGVITDDEVVVGSGVITDDEVVVGSGVIGEADSCSLEG